MTHFVLFFCLKKKKGLLEHLLRSKASVRALDEQKRTPLHWAAQHTSPEMVLLLLQHQAAVDPLDQDGRTPLLLGLKRLEKIFIFEKKKN